MLQLCAHRDCRPKCIELITFFFHIFFVYITCSTHTRIGAQMHVVAQFDYCWYAHTGEQHTYVYIYSLAPAVRKISTRALASPWSPVKHVRAMPFCECVRVCARSHIHIRTQFIFSRVGKMRTLSRVRAHVTADVNIRRDTVTVSAYCIERFQGCWCIFEETTTAKRLSAIVSGNCSDRTCGVWSSNEIMYFFFLCWELSVEPKPIE